MSLEVFLLRTVPQKKNPCKVSLIFKKLCGDWSPFNQSEAPEIGHLKQNIYLMDCDTSTRAKTIPILGVLEHASVISNVRWTAKVARAMEPEVDTHLGRSHGLGKRISEDTVSTTSGADVVTYQHRLEVGPFLEPIVYPHSSRVDKYLTEQLLKECPEIFEVADGHDFEISYDQITDLVHLKIATDHFGEAVDEFLIDPQGVSYYQSNPKAIVAYWVEDLITDMKALSGDLIEEKFSVPLGDFFFQLRFRANRLGFSVKSSKSTFDQSKEGKLDLAAKTYYSWAEPFWLMIYKPLLKMFREPIEELQARKPKPSSDKKENRLLLEPSSTLTTSESEELEQLVQSYWAFRRIQNVSRGSPQLMSKVCNELKVEPYCLSDESEASHRRSERSLRSHTLLQSEIEILLRTSDYKSFENGVLLTKVIRSAELRRAFIAALETQLVFAKTMLRCCQIGRDILPRRAASALRELVLELSNTDKSGELTSHLQSLLKFKRSVCSSLDISRPFAQYQTDQQQNYTGCSGLWSNFAQNISFAFSYQNTQVYVTQSKFSGSRGDRTIHVIRHNELKSRFALDDQYSDVLKSIQLRLSASPTFSEGVLLEAGLDLSKNLLFLVVDFRPTLMNPNSPPELLKHSSKLSSSTLNGVSLAFSGGMIVLARSYETNYTELILDCWILRPKQIEHTIQKVGLSDYVPSPYSKWFYSTKKDGLHLRVHHPSRSLVLCRISTKKGNSRLVLISLAVLILSGDCRSFSTQAYRVIQVATHSAEPIEIESSSLLGVFTLKKHLYILLNQHCETRRLFVLPHKDDRILQVSVDREIIHLDPTFKMTDGPLTPKGLKNPGVCRYYKKREPGGTFSIFLLKYKL